jgi:hypothetical protein
MAGRQRGELDNAVAKKRDGCNERPSARFCTMPAKAASMSPLVLAAKISVCHPLAEAAA